MEKNTNNQAQTVNSKQAIIKKIIHYGFFLDETYSIFHKNNLHNHVELDALFIKLVSEYSSAIDVIKDVECLSEMTFYSFKRIYLAKGDSEILFCCSSISPKKLRSEQESLVNSSISADSPYSTATDSANSTAWVVKPMSANSLANSVRNLKRENCESCPMRLKFRFDSCSRKYQISEDSNFNHNHSSISNSSEVIFGFFYLIFY